MLIERPPRLFRLLFPSGCLFRKKVKGKRYVYLTFDDGPIPEITPQVLDILDSAGAKATFFAVGDNARRHPELIEEIRRRGHRIGNHTMHHLKGMSTDTETYLRDVEEASGHLGGTRLFRPPHGLLTAKQARLLMKDYTIVLYDLVTRDYSRKTTAEDIVRNVMRYTRNGSVIVFHDSLKSAPKLGYALPEALRWLRDKGYEFALLPEPEQH